MVILRSKYWADKQKGKSKHGIRQIKFADFCFHIFFYWYGCGVLAAILTTATLFIIRGLHLGHCFLSMTRLITGTPSATPQSSLVIRVQPCVHRRLGATCQTGAFFDSFWPFGLDLDSLKTPF